MSINLNTINISIDIKTTFLVQESEPDKQRYLFAYTITIKNKGEKAARLVSRYWKITGGNGDEQEVKGDGVIGLHPYLVSPEKVTELAS